MRCPRKQAMTNASSSHSGSGDRVHSSGALDVVMETPPLTANVQSDEWSTGWAWVKTVVPPKRPFSSSRRTIFASYWGSASSACRQSHQLVVGDPTNHDDDKALFLANKARICALKVHAAMGVATSTAKTSTATTSTSSGVTTLDCAALLSQNRRNVTLFLSIRRC